MCKMIHNTFLLIMEEYLKNYNNRIIGRELARKKEKNNKTIAEYLKKLERKKILKSKTEGKNKVYYLNKNTITKYLIIKTEYEKTIKFLEEKKIIKEIIEKITPHIKGIALIFGSYAKNKEKKDSDLDLLIIGKANEKKIEEIGELYNIIIDIKKYKKYEDNPIIKEAEKNHILIKNAEEYVEERWKK